MKELMIWKKVSIYWYIFEDNVSKVEQDFCQLKGTVTKFGEDLKYMKDYARDTENIHNKLVELEDCSRRNNIRFDGLKEDSKESWEECGRRVLSLLKK